MATPQIGRIQLTKIVATIGPVSEQLPQLKKIVEAGMKTMRINFSHATYEEANIRATNIVLINSPDATDKSKNIYAVMLDTQGPEIRTGMFGDGIKEVELKAGDELTLSIDPNIRNNQTTKIIWISYENLLDTVNIGTPILLDDGAVELVVQNKNINTGVLGNKKGIVEHI
jgi:pyruvate kinase